MAWDVINATAAETAAPVNRRRNKYLIVDASMVHEYRESWNGDGGLREATTGEMQSFCKGRPEVS